MARGEFSKGSRVKGASKIKRLFRKLEPEISRELWESIEEGAKDLLETQREEVPVRSGKLRDALQVTKQRKSLSAKVGLVTKAARKKAPHGHLVVKGVRSRGIAPNDFVRRAMVKEAKPILARNERALNRALKKVARG